MIKLLLSFLFLGIFAIPSFASWPTWGSGTLYDFTLMANTTSSSVNTVGTITAGIPGWTAKATGWQITAGVAVNTTGGSYLSDLIYLASDPGPTQQIAVQAANTTGTGFIVFGVGYNSITGNAIGVRWDLELTSPTITPYLLISANGNPPATARYTTTATAGTYSSKSASDWCVITRVTQRDVNTITATVYPDNGSNAPDFTSPKATSTATIPEELFEQFGLNSYPFISSSGSGGTNHGYTRAIVYNAEQFISSPLFAKPGVTANISLTGVNTSWNGSTTFSVTSNNGTATLNSQTINSTTSATLNVTMPSLCATVTISDGVANNIFIINTFGYAYETNTIYVTSRNTDINPISLGTNTVGTGFKPGNSIVYAANSDYLGTQLYVEENTPNPGYVSSANIDGSNITLLDHTMNNPRKSLGLPNGNTLVSDYGLSQINLFSSGVNTGVWATMPVVTGNTALGTTLFPDPNRGNQITVLVCNFNTASPAVYQFDLNGNYLGTWASGSPLVRPSDIVYDGTGNVYVANWGLTTNVPGTVNMYTATGTPISTLTIGQNIFGATMLRSGKILLADENSVNLSVMYPGNYYAGDIPMNGSVISAGASEVDVKVIGPPPTNSVITITGPSTGSIGMAGNFVATLSPSLQYLPSVTATLSDNGGGGTFSPTTVTVSNGSPVANFTYTPAKGGVLTVSSINGAGVSGVSANYLVGSNGGIMSIQGNFTTGNMTIR